MTKKELIRLELNTKKLFLASKTNKEKNLEVKTNLMVKCQTQKLFLLSKAGCATPQNVENLYYNPS